MNIDELNSKLASIKSAVKSGDADPEKTIVALIASLQVCVTEMKGMQTEILRLGRICRQTTPGIMDDVFSKFGANQRAR